MNTPSLSSAVRKSLRNHTQQRRPSRLTEHNDSCRVDDGDEDDGGDDDGDDERHSLIRELVGWYKELGPGQAGACTQEGDLHPFV